MAKNKNNRGKATEPAPVSTRQRVKIIGGNGKVRWEWREAL